MVNTLLVLLAICQAPPATADPPRPDGRGEVMLQVAEYKGTTANAPIPAEMHIKNEGGSDGAGLCVIASGVINGHYQGIQDLATGKDSRLWREAKRFPGGYYPEKLTALIERIYPDEPWASYYGPNEDVLTDLSKRGYAIGATMNTGQLYNYKRIAHMISLIHFQKGALACVVDNNNPGRYSWMPADEFVKRWKDRSGDGWAWVWTKLPGRMPSLPGLPSLPKITQTHIVWAMGALLIFLLARGRRPTAA